MQSSYHSNSPLPPQGGSSFLTDRLFLLILLVFTSLLSVVGVDNCFLYAKIAGEGILTVPTHVETLPIWGPNVKDSKNIVEQKMAGKTTVKLSEDDGCAIQKKPWATLLQTSLLLWYPPPQNLSFSMTPTLCYLLWPLPVVNHFEQRCFVCAVWIPPSFLIEQWSGIFRDFRWYFRVFRK